MDASVPRLRLGIDIGGTFTDLALQPRPRARRDGKELTTHSDLAAGTARPRRPSSGAHGSRWRESARSSHATTLGANTVIERKGWPTALLTTEGFRDVLSSSAAAAPHLTTCSAASPSRWCRASCVFEVPERLLHDGTVVPAARRAARRARRASCAWREDRGRRPSCLLHSYAQRRPRARGGGDRARDRAGGGALPLLRGRADASASTSAPAPRPPTPTSARCSSAT